MEITERRVAYQEWYETEFTKTGWDLVIDIIIPDGFNSEIHFDIIEKTYLNVGWKNVILFPSGFIRFTVLNDKKLAKIK